jgi:1,4-alpha-glucan branching enzyme
MIVKHGKRKATFIFDQETESQVFLIGDFNGWQPEKDAMEYKNGKWQITKNLSSGAYQFKYFVLNDDQNRWFNDWRADAYVKSPYGGENSVIIID